MFRITAARRKPDALRPKVLGLLTVLWLNMAVLPCAMAFESSETCPHCPPAAEHDMAPQHEHSEVKVQPDCATVQVECCDYAEISVETRGLKLEAKPASEAVIASAPPIAVVPVQTSAQRFCTADPPGACGGAPPLHVLHCVYLK
jgi:hypothetical protein